VDLTRKGVKELILAGRNVPPSVEQRRVKRWHQSAGGWDGVRPVVSLFGDALHVTHGTLVELSHNVVFKQIATLNLTPSLVGLSVARVDANDVGQTVWIDNALGKGELTFLEQTRGNGTAVCGHGGQWMDSESSRGNGQCESNCQQSGSTGSTGVLDCFCEGWIIHNLLLVVGILRKSMEWLKMNMEPTASGCVCVGRTRHSKGVGVSDRYEKQEP
jgi:hypothetical protein